MKRAKRWGTLSVLVLAAAIGCRQSAREPQGGVEAKAPTPGALASDASGRTVLYWYDPMVPGSRFDKPGKSPFMDMDLVPRYADEEPEGGTAAPLALSAEAIRAAGIATVPVERGAVSSEIRAVGTLEADETRLVRVSARVAGRVEKLYADFTGQSVRAGAPLYELYSPELVATQREYLLAIENRQRLSDATPEARRSAEELVAAARDRLRLWGISTAQIADLEKTRRPELSLVFRSPIRGVVLEKKVVEGQYVAEGDAMYLLADLSSVWLQARVYEYELGKVRVGQPARITVQAFPGREFSGSVAFIEPTLERDTQTARVRIVLPNPKGDLKPGMYADAVLDIPSGRGLTIPRSALIDTGVRRVVYVETSPGAFTPRDVKTGEMSRDRVAVLEGLREGERVVAQANFFLDSQAQLSGGARVQWSGALEVKATPRAETKP